jgi:DNA repair protein RecO (recombination protein O)
MILKTEALAIRMAPFSQTSRIVTWLTPGFGRLATLAKGALRPKSLFLGQCDLFRTCEILFYSRDPGGLHILRECSPVETRDRLRGDWRGAACASYAADLVFRSALEGTPQEGLYELGTRSFDALARGAACAQVLFWFELKLAELLGVAPRLDACPGCGRDISSPPSAAATFCCVRGGLLCPDCARAPRAAIHGRHPRPLRLSADTLRILRLWRACRLPDAAARTPCGVQQILELRRVLGVFLEFHLDMMPPGRSVALALLSGSLSPEQTEPGEGDHE